MMRNSTKIINMGCMDKSFCPTLFIPNLIDWEIEDPKGEQIEKVREIRDDIDSKVRKLAAELAKDSMQANL
jgi:arsenate reductase (thioredoxin)